MTVLTPPRGPRAYSTYGSPDLEAAFPSSFASSELDLQPFEPIAPGGEPYPGYDPDMPPDPDFQFEPRRRASWLRRIGMLLAFLIVLGGCIYGAYYAFTSSSDEKLADGTRVTVTIPKGASADKVAAVLADAGLVRSERMFGWRMRFSGDQSTLRAGKHQLVMGWKYDRIVEELTKAPPAAPTYTTLVREGLRVTEIVKLVDEENRKSSAEGSPKPAFTGAAYRKQLDQTSPPAGFAVPRDAAEPLEGFLFPATYELKVGATAQDMVAKQLQAFQTNWSQVNLSEARKANLTPYDVLIIASMIEREAQVASERPKVAAVIWNRLRIGMSLGIDATIQYAVDPLEWEQNLKQSQLDIDSPYNTRKVAGLPPTPIANPGLASMQAAAHPAKTKDLYYVAKGDGSGKHFFSESYDEFLSHQ